MFEDNKYLVTFIIIIALILFSFLVYKIIKFNESIKDIVEENDMDGDMRLNYEEFATILMAKPDTKK